MYEYQYTVSIVIVCMNNLKNLYPCLDSIKKNTTVSYETFVVAFLFSEENLKRLREDYPWVKVIINNELKGFSENNNLALRQASGRYCFVVNDDTYHSMPVIDSLVETIEKLPDNVAVISPKTLNVDGSVQRCGRGKLTLWTYVLGCFRLSRFVERRSRYVNKRGVFQTYNLSGSCFMIKTDVFKKMGWFDERYYFCPEDVALSTLLNKKGYKCYVNADIRLTHICGGTWSKTICATKPASVKGSYIFYGDGNVFKQTVFFLFSLMAYSSRTFSWIIKSLFRQTEKNRIMRTANTNALKTLFSTKTPKEIFIHYYQQLKRSK